MQRANIWVHCQADRIARAWSGLPAGGRLAAVLAPVALVVVVVARLG